MNLDTVNLNEASQAERYNSYHAGPAEGPPLQRQNPRGPSIAISRRWRGLTAPKMPRKPRRLWPPRVTLSSKRLTCSTNTTDF